MTFNKIIYLSRVICISSCFSIFLINNYFGNFALSNKLLSHIFLLTISLAFFLDAINVDAIFTSHAMIREEYEGQSSEMYDSHNDEQVILYTYSGTTGNRTFQPADNSTQHIYLIDEDSVSLAAQPTMTEEAGLYLCRSSSIRHTALHVPLFDFYSLCKLQI
jgi:hypothetical protein